MIHSEEKSSRPTPASAVVVPDHELIRLIGRGSYGEVWLARNALGAFRAVKIVRENTFRHKRPFEREFNGVQKFEPISRAHEGLMDVLQVGRNDAAGYFYCVMELADDVVSGPTIDPGRYSPRTLAAEMARHKRLPIDECQRIGVRIASALDFLHRHGLIHRDLKPSNIVFVHDVPKLADIGLVTEMAEARSYVGTEGFIPPEGPGTVQADIYSLGKVLYEISTGKDRHEYPDLPTFLDDAGNEKQFFALNEVILRACRPDPRARYRSAAAVVESLQRPARRPGWRRGRTAVIAALAAAALLLGYVGHHRPQKDGDREGHRPVAGSSSSVALPGGAVAWWKGEGTFIDAIGTNSITAPDGVGFSAGKVGSGFTFDGQVHRMTALNAEGLNFGADEDFSIEAWIRPEKAETSYGLMGIVTKGIAPEEGVFQGYELGLINGRLRFAFSDTLTKFGALIFGDSGPDLRDGHFHHVAVTIRRRSRTGGTLLVDGRAILSFDPTPVSGDLSNTEPLRFGHGALAPFNQSFKGTIDEVTLYRRALTPEEIGSVYAAGGDGKYVPDTSLKGFDARVDLTTDRGPAGMAVGDFDGDGRRDFAVATAYGHKILVYRNVGSSGSLAATAFELPLELPVTKGSLPDYPEQVFAADCDGDGKPDLVVPDRNANGIEVFQNISSPGAMAFAPPVFFAAGKDPRRIAVADLDGDGRPDVVTADNGDNTISILRNAGTKGRIDRDTFAGHLDLPTGQTAGDVAVADFNGDGKPDIAVAGIKEATICLFQNVHVGGTLAASSFEQRSPLPAPLNIACFIAGDVDGDGKADLISGSTRRILSIFRNTGSLGGTNNWFALPVNLTAPGWVQGINLADMDEDGRPDLVFVTQEPALPDHPGSMSIYENHATPGTLAATSFGPRRDYTAGWNVWGLAVADFDGDTRLDCIFGNFYSGTLSIYRNNGSFRH